MLALYEDLDRVYTDEHLTEEHKYDRKRALLTSILARVNDSALTEKIAYRQVVALGPWNNARLAQFRTYNKDRAAFAALLEQQGGDLKAFMAEVARVTRGQPDPYQAMRDAVSGGPVGP